MNGTVEGDSAPRGRRYVRWLLIAVLLAMVFSGYGSGISADHSALRIRSAGLVDPLALTPHAPIHITSNAAFNASNGVRGGSGTAADPYIIADWLFDAALYPHASSMVWLENTDQHVTVRNCQVIHFETIGVDYQAFYVGKYPGEITTPTVAPPTIDLTSNVTLLNNDIDSRFGYGIQITEGSSDVLVKGNLVYIHPDGTSGRDLIYGINVARGTHVVTVEGNAVTARSAQYTTIGIHLSDYYVSEQRRASQLVARNNTVIDASGGIHIESSRSTLVRDNMIYQTVRNSLLLGWPRAITLRESALNASILHNTIRNEVTGIVIGAASLRWATIGPIAGASNATIQDNAISTVDSGISIGNVSGTRVVNTLFSDVAFQELNLQEEGGPPRDVTLTDPILPIRIRAPTAPVRIHWSWTNLAHNAEYNLTAMNGPTTFDTRFTTGLGGGASVDAMQPRTNRTSVTIYRLFGPLNPPDQSGTGLLDPRIPTLAWLVVAASVGVVASASVTYGVRRRRRGRERRDSRRTPPP